MFKLVLVMWRAVPQFFATFSLFLLEASLEKISGLEAYWELLCLCPISHFLIKLEHSRRRFCLLN